MSKIDLPARVTHVSWLYQVGQPNVESSAYLNKTESELCSISKSVRKILNQYGPLTLPWVVPLLTGFKVHVKLLKLNKANTLLPSR